MTDLSSLDNVRENAYVLIGNRANGLCNILSYRQRYDVITSALH